MVVPVFLIAIFSLIFSLPNCNRQVNLLFSRLLPLIWLILVFISAFRPTTMPDYGNYLTGFRHGFERGEPAFQLIIDFVKYVSSDIRALFALMASVSIGLNLLAIRKWANSIPLSLLFYLSNMYILHDMIQIRCAVAASIFLFTIPYIYNKSIIKFTILVLFAVCFHYSAMAIFPLFALSPNSFKLKIWLSLIPLSYVLVGLGLTVGHFIEQIPIPIIQDFNNRYILIMERDGIVAPNIFNSLQILRIFVVTLFIIFSKYILPYNKYFCLWIKIYIISMILFVLSSDFPVIAFRISEFYQVVEFLLFPMLIFLPIKNSFLKRICVPLIALFYLLINTFYLKLLI